jgi:hypothetical protein
MNRIDDARSLSHVADTSSIPLQNFRIDIQLDNLVEIVFFLTGQHSLAYLVAAQPSNKLTQSLKTRCSKIIQVCDAPQWSASRLWSFSLACLLLENG